MNKIKEIMDKYGLTEHQVTRFTGQPSRSDTLRSVAKGDREVTSINLKLLTSYARGLGLRLQDLVNDYELDGSSTQVTSIKKYVDMLLRLNEHVKKFNNEGYIISNGIDKQHYPLKKEFEFLNPKLTHSQQKTNEIYLLNNSYLPILKDKKIKQNKSLAKLMPRYNKYIKSVIMYSPLEGGGDLKLIADVYDRTGFYLFSEILGSEWIDTEDNKTICYYKAHSNRLIKPELINEIEKQEISELEFYKGLNTQLPKYNVVEQ